MAMGNIYGVRGSRRGIFGGLTLFIGPNQADRRHELMLARIAAGNSPNRTPSAAHIAHLNRTGGSGGGGGGGFGTGSVQPGSSSLDGGGTAEPGEQAPIQGLNIPAGAIPALMGNTPPAQNPNQRRLTQSDLSAFLRRGG